jgi:hypothetical protein
VGIDVPGSKSQEEQQQSLEEGLENIGLGTTGFVVVPIHVNNGMVLVDLIGKDHVALDAHESFVLGNLGTIRRPVVLVHVQRRVSVVQVLKVRRVVQRRHDLHR